MSNEEQSLQRLNDKLQQVAQRYQSLQKENQQLTREIRVLKEREEAREKKVIDLELKIAAIKTATGRLDDGEKKEIDKRLNHYIREIDRCIALLSD
jgi:chromosome segregation ATPase